MNAIPQTTTLDRLNAIMRAEITGIETDSKPSDSFRDLGLDSLDEVQLAMAIEESFGIEIPDAELEKLVTVGDAIKFIDRALAK